jgi:hypothetical protein
MCACSAKSDRVMDKRELQEYISDPDNGLIQVAHFQNCVIKCQYFPCSLLTSNPGCEEYVYFKLFVPKGNCALEALSSKFLMVENHRDTLQVIDSYKEDLADTKHVQVLMAFSKSNIFGTCDAEILLKSEEYNNFVTLFPFKGDDLTRIPRLKI